MIPTILLVIHTPDHTEKIHAALRDIGNLIDAQPHEVLDIVSQQRIDLAIISAEKKAGRDTVNDIKRHDAFIECIVIDTAKKINALELKISVGQALKKHLIKKENLSLRHTLNQSSKLGTFIGTSSFATGVHDAINTAVQSDYPLIIQGPQGCEKETIAYTIHQKSPRGSYPFAVVHCGEATPYLLEHVLGEMTVEKNRKQKKRGMFERCECGTLVFDHIELIPRELQKYLAHIMTAKTYTPLRASLPIALTARIMATTSTPLASLQENDLFDESLCNHFLHTIEVPSLYERIKDLPLIAHEFIHSINTHYHTAIDGISDEALLEMSLYEWPGNTRELKLMLEYLCLLHEKGTIDSSALPLKLITNFVHYKKPVLKHIIAELHATVHH